MSNQDNTGDKQEGFLNRWSARKRKHTDESDVAVIDEQSAPVLQENTPLGEAITNDALLTEDSVNDADALVDNSAQPATIDDEPPLLTDDDMPSIPSLTAKSDLSMFFNRGVSATLRKAALRHVFSLPVYNIRDGLNDYDDDFTNFEPLGDIVTSDMKWHKARKEREAAEKAEAQRLAEEEAKQQEMLEQDDQSDEELDDSDAPAVGQDENPDANEDANESESLPENDDGAELVAQSQENESVENTDAINAEIDPPLEKIT